MSFSDPRNYDSIKQVKRFMFADIEKSLKLNDNINVGAPAFLVALGLCCYTEYWGKLMKGISSGCSKTTFNAFLDELDPTYYPFLREQVDVYHDIRCGLAHSYLIAKSANIDAITHGEHGIVYDAKNQRYTFYIKTYFEEFKCAVNRYIINLQQGTASIPLLEKALEGKAELI
jgi:hypothetical protein